MTLALIGGGLGALGGGLADKKAPLRGALLGGAGGAALGGGGGLALGTGGAGVGAGSAPLAAGVLGPPAAPTATAATQLGGAQLALSGAGMLGRATTPSPPQPVSASPGQPFSLGRPGTPTAANLGGGQQFFPTQRPQRGRLSDGTRAARELEFSLRRRM